MMIKALGVVLGGIFGFAISGIPIHAATISSQTVTIGDIDDLNNFDGDGIVNLGDGSFVPNQITTLLPDGDLTDEQLVATSPNSFDFTFEFLPSSVTAASITILHGDVDRAGEGFDIAPIEIDGELTDFSLSNVTQILNSNGTNFALDTFVISEDLLGLLDDGSLIFSILINEGNIALDGAAVDFITLNVESQVAAIPLPAALPLLAGGLGLMGVMGWRRKKAV